MALSSDRYAAQPELVCSLFADFLDGVFEPAPRVSDVRNDHCFAVYLGFLARFSVGLAPVSHLPQGQGWPGLLLPPVKSADAHLAQDQQIWSCGPEKLQVDQIVGTGICGISHGVNFLCDLTFEVDELDGFQTSKSEARAELDQIVVERVSGVCVGGDLWIRHFNVQPTPWAPEEGE